MKKILSMLTLMTLALLLAVPVFAASKPIDVFINGSKVSFKAGTPYLENNSVLVPFRAIFENLGLEVLWDAKTGTVTGTGSNLKIQLKIGSNRASINGIIKKLIAAPITTNGTTYVPLRFIGEATGGTVLWDPAAKSVQITTAAAKTLDEVAITSLFNNMTTYFNEKNVKALGSLIVADSSFSDYVSHLDSMFKNYDIKNTLNSLTIVSLDANEAIVTTSETSLRISGLYTPDVEDHYTYTIVKKDDNWKISDVQREDSKILLTHEQAIKSANAPQNEATAINSTLTNYYKALNEENVKGIMATMTSGGEEYDTKLSSDYQNFLSNYDIHYTLGTSNIFYFNGNEAAVYAEDKSQEAGQSESYDQGTIYVFYKISDGTWKIDQTYSIF